MTIKFEYQDQGRPWQAITLHIEVSIDDVPKKLNDLKRQFPNCNLRALDEYQQVIETRYQF
jgi:hypothetical protein